MIQQVTRLAAIIVNAIAAAFFLALGFNAAQSNDARYTLDQHGRILVPVQLGSQSYHYLLGTSSRRIGVKEGNLDALNIKRYERSVLEEFSIVGEIKLPMAGLSSMTLAGRTITDRYITLYPKNAGADGILGYEAFGEQLVHINPSKKTIGFHAHAGQFSANDWLLVDGRHNRYGGIIVQTAYQGVLLDVLFASSLSHSILDVNAYSALKAQLQQPKRSAFVNVAIGMTGRTRTFQEQTLPQFKIGDFSLGDVKVVTTNLAVADSAGPSSRMLLILGADVIGSRELTLDYRSYQLWYPVQ